MKEYKISIIIPVYNVEKYLSKCLDSVINQIYKNLEIILIDDGSPDNCGKICDEYAKKDSRIKVIHKENGGVSSARNIGLDIATGDYIGFIDSDDYIELDMFECLVNSIIKYNLDICECNFIIEEKNNISYVKCKYENILENRDVIKNFLSDNIRPETCNKLYKKELFDNIRFDTNIILGEDAFINYQIMKRASKIYNINQYKYHYVKREGSAMNSSITKKSLGNIDTIETMIENEKNDIELYNICIYRYLRTCFTKLNLMVLNNSYENFNYVREKVLKYKKYIVKNCDTKFRIGMLMLMLGQNFYKYGLKFEFKILKFLKR